MPEAFDAIPLEPDDKPPSEDEFSVDDFEVSGDDADESTLLELVNESDDADDSLRDVQDLTLAEFVSVFAKSPAKVGAAFWDVLKPTHFGQSRLVTVDTARRETQHVIDEAPPEGQPLSERVRNVRINRHFVQVVLWVVAFVVAFIGNGIMAADVLVRRSESIQLHQGLPFLFAGFLIWLVAELIGAWPQIWAWWQQKDFIGRFSMGVRIFPIGLAVIGLAVIWDSTDAPRELVLSIVTPGVQLVLLAGVIWVLLDVVGYILSILIERNPGLFPLWMYDSIEKRKEKNTSPLSDGYVDYTPWYMKFHPIRLVFALFGVILSILTWFGTSGNHISFVTFIIWLLSVAAWAMTFAPNINVMNWVTGWIDGFRRVHWREYVPVVLALVLIMGVGWYFRFHDLRDHPREMTDDHVEKILDSGLVHDGYRPIFFANNGGREPFQMYAIALASNLPGLGIDHFTIKVVAATESLLTIPIFFWLAFELLEGEPRRRRILVGLIAAALLATSYWHVAITRQGLRIALTPLVASLLLIHLSRALRRNHLADFIKAGLVLGFGLYTYQAVRMLPVVIVVAVGIAFYFVATNWKDRFRYILHLAILVWISFVAFIPMFHYSVEYPELFWRRTTGRLLGDDVIETTLDDGTIVMREATIGERVQAFQDNVPQLMSNIRNVLLMFNWKGDVGAISGVPNRPAMDVLSGTLFIVGLAAWLALMVKRRDIAMWLIPIFIFLMLLPSALSIAFPVENPSHTRTSGAMPGVYLIAALPLALFVEAFFDMRRKIVGRVLGVGFCTLVIFAVFNSNAYTYFEVYPEVYAESFDPYTEPGAYLKGFAISGGSYSNAFMIGYPHWWSHRAIGLAGGLETLWPNGIVGRENIPRFLRDSHNRTDDFAFDPNRDMLFFYSPDDEETGDLLREFFPNGYAILERTYAENNDYMVYRVPALGSAGFETWLLEHFSG